MAGRIKDEDIALVRERAPIADVVGEYLQLRNAGGGSLKGLCPFHDEKSPSFNVTPSKNLWYCFGCSEGGDVISFVQQIDSLSFTEAVESLARQSGIQLRYESSEGRSTRRDENKRQRLLEAHKAAAEFYAHQLFRSAEGVVARRFLDDRGFVGSHAEHFGLGYAPPGWENLVAHLRRKGFSDQELVEGGLASQGRRGAYDRFRNRVLWPIREVTGEVVGFGARKLNPDEDGPKYLNSPESPIFHKGRILYGLDLAKRQISRESKAIVVEGYTDVMACHLAGETTAVATCGTSFGEDHVKILRRMLLGRSNQGGKVVFTFDGDKAGQKAAARAFSEEHAFSSETYVAIQPDGLDPGDLWLQQGGQSISDLVEAAVPMYEFRSRTSSTTTTWRLPRAAWPRSRRPPPWSRASATRVCAGAGARTSTAGSGSWTRATSCSGSTSTCAATGPGATGAGRARRAPRTPTGPPTTSTTRRSSANARPSSWP